MCTNITVRWSLELCKELHNDREKGGAQLKRQTHTEGKRKSLKGKINDIAEQTTSTTANLSSPLYLEMKDPFYIHINTKTILTFPESTAFAWGKSRRAPTHRNTVFA